MFTRDVRSPPQTVAALRQEEVRQWNLLDQLRCLNGRKREVVIEAEGGFTRY